MGTSRNVLGREASKGDGTVANIEQKKWSPGSPGTEVFKERGSGPECPTPIKSNGSDHGASVSPKQGALKLDVQTHGESSLKETQWPVSTFGMRHKQTHPLLPEIIYKSFFYQSTTYILKDAQTLSVCKCM